MARAQEAPDPGLGVFDTLLVRHGRAVDLRAHVDRVTRSAHQLYAVPADADRLAGRIADEVRGLATARVRTTYAPGVGEWTIEATEIPEPSAAPEPRTLAVCRVAGGLGEHKWVDRGLAEAPGPADDALIVDDHDVVLECGTANVFVVTGGVLTTPPLDGRILPGTVRARVLAVARAGGIEVAERPVALAELGAADEVFATSSIRGAQPVVACAGVGSWHVGPRVAWLRSRLGQDD